MEFTLTDAEKQALLKLARDTITMRLGGGGLPLLPKLEGNLAVPAGAFVTLHKKGQLRGCIGHIVGKEPLARTVCEMAIASATEDPRFPPVRADEMKDIDIEISVLSPLERVRDVSKIEVGVHGIVMGKGWNRGVLLPQVAVEYGWDRETFLEHTCMKAGLEVSAWKDADTVIEIFSAQVFGEKQKGG